VISSALKQYLTVALPLASVSQELITDLNNLTATISTANLVDGATVALNASLGGTFYLTSVQNPTISAPTLPLFDGQKIIIAFTASGSNRTLSLASGTGGFTFGTTTTSLSATTSGTTDYIGCIYNLSLNTWMVVGYAKGF
jgi:hypothetical protein